MRKIQIIIFSLLFGICNDSISQILLSFSVENETREIVNVSDFLRRKLNLSDTFEFQSINGIPVFKNEEGIIHERYVQCYKGIIIENTDIRVRKKNGIIISANGDYINNSQINIEHTQSLSEACKIAETYIRSQYVELKNNSLTISPQKEIVLFVKTTESKVIACYKIKVFSIDNLISENVYIDACDGTVVNSFTGILHAIGNADTRFSGTQNISTKYNGLNYILFDTTRGNGIETLNLKRSLNFNSAVNFKDNDDNWTSIEFNNSNMDDGALDAHWGAMKTYDYFKNVHGRNSFDGNNSKLRNYVHAKVLLNMDYAYDNAVWVIDSNFMIYINGWLKHSNVMSAIDIVGHEIAHGVCKYTATLSYQGESGAINESLSDIWGACIEKFATSNKQTYLCGEDLGVPERSMSNPKVYFQPNTYKGIFWGETSNPSNNNDWGNVHTNSGVMNYWFYLLSEGGSGTNDNGWNYSVNGISIDSAAKIVYKAETEYMTSNTNFVKAREYTIKAAQDIFGVNSSKIQSVKDAWYAVGVYNDLYIRDTVTDNGSMPSDCYSTWDSPDIWIMDTNGNWVNNPHGNTKYVVCVRIHNRRDVASSGTERLFLNWAKAGANDKWYEYWTGENPLPCGAPKGGVIGSANGKIIPSIPANGTYIDTVHWITPAGENYQNCSQFNYNQWHFCLLARIHDDDVIAHENEQLTDVHPLVRNHNNVAQLNVYLSSAIGDYKSQLSFGNATQDIIGRTICMVPKIVNGTSITDYAEIYLTLDNGLLSSLNTTNLGNLTWVGPNTLRWSSGQPCIPLTLPADCYYTMQVTINFLADHVPDNNNFDFHIVLRNAYGDSILGGEHYRCVRAQGRYFQAVANGATTIVSGQSAYLYANDILESATYEWFDGAGNSVGNGIGCNVNPTQTTTYTLAVTADADGYRAYDQVTVTVQQVGITSISPNPSNGQVTVSYRLAANVASATIQILNTNGQVVGSYPVSGGSSAVTGNVVINTSSMATGGYTVRMVSSKGNIFDSKTLIIQ